MTVSYQLKDFQQHGVRELVGMLTKYGGAILADEMGLGKTPQAAAVASIINTTGRTLVVCPGTVRHQWVKWLTLTTGVEPAFMGPPSERPRKSVPSDIDYAAEWQAWEDGHRLGVVSYNLMDRALAAKRKPQLVIFDEAHNYFSGRANAYVKQWWNASGYVRYKLVLTGTPYNTKPAQLWQPLNVALGMMFGRARDFDERYCNGREGTYGWENNGVNKATFGELEQRLKSIMVRRLKSDVAKDLPRVTRTVRWVEGHKSVAGSLANMGKSIDALRKAGELTLRHKIPEVVDVVANTGRPTVTFTWRREDCELISARLNEAGLPCEYITGEWSAQQRQVIISAAIESKSHLVATYGAASTGLDGLQLLYCDVVLHAISPVLSELLQAMGRVDRMGQKNPVTITVVAMKNSVDELVVDRLLERIETYQKVVGAEQPAQELAAGLLKGSSTDITDQSVLDAIFEDIT